MTKRKFIRFCRHCTRPDLLKVVLSPGKAYSSGPKLVLRGWWIGGLQTVTLYEPHGGWHPSGVPAARAKCEAERPKMERWLAQFMETVDTDRAV